MAAGSKTKRGGRGDKVHHVSSKGSDAELHREEVCDSSTSDLSTWQSSFIIAAWCFCLAYLAYCIYAESNDVLKTDPYKFRPGWRFTGRLADGSNFEWEFWYDFWTGQGWKWLAGHVLINQVIHLLKLQYGNIMNIGYSLVVAGWLMTWQLGALLLVYIFAGYIVAHIGSVLLVWLLALTVLSALNSNTFMDYLKALHGGEYDRSLLLLTYAVSMVSMRCVSFALDWHEQCSHKKPAQNERKHSKSHCNSENSEHVKFGFLQFLHYCLYLPVFFSGPMFNYNKFYHQYYQSSVQWNYQNVRTLVILIIRVAFSALLCEVMLHYMYFSALHKDLDLMQSVSLWTLAGTGYYNGQFFMVKYVVLYGIPQILAKTDHMDIPGPPSCCISRIGTSLKYWRTFDKGLYEFLTRYIYIPAGGSRYGVARQLLSSALCFLFVFIWHGATFAVFCWVFMNFIDIVIETLAASLNNLPAVRSFQEKYISKTAVRHIKGLLKAPFLLMTTIAGNTFVAGLEASKIFAWRLIVEGFPQSLMICIFCFYCLALTDYIVTSYEKHHRSTVCKLKVT